MQETHFGDRRLFAPATARNRDPILSVLSGVLPISGLVVEIAAGSGEHAVYCARALPYLEWQPTDPDPRALASIDAHRAAENIPNLRPACKLDAAATEWPFHQADAVICINMIHIAPWSACKGLMVGAARILPAGGPLYLYGPFSVNGVHTSESNLRFDADLRARNPAWGVRDLTEVIALAARGGLRHDETIAMPANNLSVVFRKET